VINKNIKYKINVSPDMAQVVFLIDGVRSILSFSKT